MHRLDDLRRFALTATLTALAYALAGWLSLRISTFVADIVAAVWLAAGIGAAASVRFGWAGVVGVLAGALALHTQILPFEDALRFALGATAGATLMGFLPRYLQPFSPTLDYVSSVAKFALVAVPLWAGEVISPEDAARYVSEEVTVRGEVVSATYARSSNGQPTFLNFGKPYPDHIFTLVIWGRDRAKFPVPPEKAFAGKTVATVQVYRNKPEIIVTSPSQISVAQPTRAE